MQNTFIDLINQDTLEQQADMEKWKAEREAKKKSSQFNLGSLLPAAIATIAAPITGGASLASLPGYFAGQAVAPALGEALRSSTGSDIDMASIASGARNLFAKPYSQPIGPTTKSGDFSTSPMGILSEGFQKGFGDTEQEIKRRTLVDLAKKYGMTDFAIDSEGKMTAKTQDPLVSLYKQAQLESIKQTTGKKNMNAPKPVARKGYSLVAEYGENPDGTRYIKNWKYVADKKGSLSFDK